MFNRINSIFFFLLIFSGFLAGQIFFGKLSSTANTLNQKESKVKNLEKAYKRVEGKSIYDETFKIKDQKAPIVIINFWASWCVPCLQEFPSLVGLKRQLGDDVFVLGINSDEDDIEKNIKKTYRKYKLNFPSILDENEKWSDLFGVEHLPASFVFANGKLIKATVGVTDFRESEFVKKLEKEIQLAN